MTRRVITRTLTIAALAAALIPTAAQATGGQHKPPAPPVKDCGACCADLNEDITQLTQVFNTYRQQTDQQIAELRNQVVNLTNYINEVNLRLTTVINRQDALSCRSSREYTFRLRREVDGSAIVALENPAPGGPAVEVAPEEAPLTSGQPRGSFRREDGRFVVSANYSEIEAPKGQFRTVTVYARLANGRHVRLVQALRLCLERDGNPNDTPAQDRAND